MIGAVGTLTYGDAPIQLAVTGGSGTGAVTYAVTNGDAVSVNAYTGAVTVEKAGTATVTVTKAGDYRYNAASASVTLTVAKAPLHVAAVSQSIGFGAAVPSFSCTYDGFVNRENQSVLSGSPAYACSYTRGDAAGVYDIQISAGSLSAVNYSFIFSKGLLSVDSSQQAPLSPHTADGQTSYVYGAAGVTLTATGGSGTGAVTYTVTDGDAVSVNAYTGAVTIEKAGTATVTVTKAGDGNYEAASGRITLTVEKAPLHVTAVSQSIEFGADVPPFSCTYAGFVYGENQSVLFGSPDYACAYTPGDAEGVYDIQIYAGSLSAANYSFVFSKGLLSVDSAQRTPQDPLSLYTTDGQNSYVYGTPGVMLTFTGGSGTGAVTYAVTGGDAVSVNAYTGAVTIEKAGTATVTVTKAGDDDYNAAYASIPLTVTKAPLHVTAVSQSIEAGAAVPAFSCTYDGFVNGDNQFVLSGSPSYACSYEPGDAAGVYDIQISAGSLSAENYNFTFSKGLLTVESAQLGQQAPLYLNTADNKTSYVYGDTGVTLTTTGGSGTGAVTYAVTIGDAVSVNAYTGAVTVEKAGTATVTVTKAGDSQYEAASADITLTVAKAPLTLSVASAALTPLEPTAGVSVSGLVGADTATVSMTAVTGLTLSGNTLTYDGTTTFTNTNNSLSLTANAGANYTSDAQTVNVTVIDGQAATRPIPVNQGNFLNFNTYANTTNGLTRHYKLMTNAVLSIPATGSNWTAIGTAATPFTGSFDGGGYTITNMTINLPSANYQGLFGYVGTGGAVKNVGLLNGSVAGANYVGGVTGANAGTVENSHNTGAVTGNNTVGGVVGNNNTDGIVKNSHNTGAVNGGNEVGGVAGNNNNGTVENCYNTGIVTGNATSSNSVGGVVGYNTNGGTVTNSHNTVAVSGLSYVGGVTGWNDGGTVETSYNTGAVSGDDEVGGVAGYNDGTVRNCYNSGTVSGGYNIGGVVGYNQNGTVRNCVALNETVTGNNVIGRVAGNASGTLADNYAWSGMTLMLNGAPIPATSALSGTDGANVSAADLKTQAAWTTAGFTFGAGAWTWTTGYMPSLSTERLVWPAYLVATGTATDPFIVSDAATLQRVGSGVGGWDLDKHYLMTANIDLSTVPTTAGSNWEPIGDSLGNSFTGSFDGDGHTISNLIINRPSDDGQGLFGIVGSGGVVKNVGLADTCSVTGHLSVGGVVGVNSGTVENCYNTGAVTGNGDNTGGVAGENNGTVDNCYNTGAVSGIDYVGGVVGWSSTSAVMQNCYNTGAVNGNRTGGVAGYNNGTVQNCYNTGAVNGTTQVGGVVGRNNNAGTVRNCVALNETVTGTSDVGRVVGDNAGTLTTNYAWSGMKVNGMTIGGTPGNGTVNGANFSAADLKNATRWTTAGFTFGAGNPWTWTPGYMPSLSTERLDWPDYLVTGSSAGDPIQISNATALQSINSGLNKHYALTADIDLNGVSWTPIGDDTNPFTGTFDGGGHTIENLTINRPSDEYQGLFGNIGGGSVVRNVGLVNSSVTGNRYVGGVVGQNYYATVENCYNTGTVTGNNNEVGGVVGYNNCGTVEYCHNTGTVTGNGRLTGGVVGWSDNAQMRYCYNTGTVTGSGEEVGGVAGRTSVGTVEYCYNTGNVISSDRYVGGVVGNNRGTVQNCYNTGTVTGSNTVGGVVGYNSLTNISAVRYCYNTGNVISNDRYVGGVVGRNYDNTMIVDRCVALNQTVANSGTPGSGRVVGYSSGIRTDLYARNDMTLTDGSTISSSLNGIHGEDITITEYRDPDWWINIAGFDDPWWDWGTKAPAFALSMPGTGKSRNWAGLPALEPRKDEDLITFDDPPRPHYEPA